MLPRLMHLGYVRGPSTKAPGQSSSCRHPHHVIGCHLQAAGSYRIGREAVDVHGPFLGVVPIGDEDSNGLFSPREFYFCLFTWPGLSSGDGTAVELATTEGRARLPHLRHLGEDELRRAVAIFRQLQVEQPRPEAAAHLRSGARLLDLLALWASPSRDQAPAGPAEAYRALIEQYALDSGVGLAGLAARVGMHPDHLATVFRARFGTTPVAYRIALRLDHARDLLAGSSLPVGRIARETGFADPRYFARCFRQRFGASPRAFARSVEASSLWAVKPSERRTQR